MSKLTKAATAADKQQKEISKWSEKEISTRSQNLLPLAKPLHTADQPYSLYNDYTLLLALKSLNLVKLVVCVQMYCGPQHVPCP